MVLLSSSNSDGVCHVTTVNLDGETNLKTYQSPPETSTSFKDVISLSELVGVVECEQVRKENGILNLICIQSFELKSVGFCITVLFSFSNCDVKNSL